MKQQKSNWLLAMTLTIPMVIFFANYIFKHSASLEPTGFLQYDNVSYIAYARQYVDAENLTLLYSNPFNDSDEYRAIYFQPQTLFFSLLLGLGIPPGWILIPFTILCSLICFRILIGIYDYIIPAKKYRVLSIWLFAWGGGVLVLAGLIAQQVSDNPAANNIFVLDPANGWWGLNFGRSLFFSCEAYYHALFMGSILCLLKQKWSFALLLSFILSASHPFTGIENLSIIFCWAFADRFLFKNRAIPSWFPFAVLIVLSLHLFYYLYYLNSFPDHRSVSEQYALNWRLRFFNMLPAYILVGGMALVKFIRPGKLAGTVNPAQIRLCVCWFLVAFCLANHELFIKPMQPVHFTRGYIWTSLFLLGLPVLHKIFETLSKPGAGRVALLGFIAVFFSDNLVWTGSSTFAKAKKVSTSYIDEEHQKIFNTIDRFASNQSMVIGTDPVIPYMSTVYTKAYPLYSHPYTTPFAADKKASLGRFIKQGIIAPAWRSRHVFLIFNKNDSLELRRSLSLTFETKNLLETSNYKLMEATIPQ